MVWHEKKWKRTLNSVHFVAFGLVKVFTHTKKTINWMRDVEILHIRMTH